MSELCMEKDLATPGFVGGPVSPSNAYEHMLTEKKAIVVGDLLILGTQGYCVRRVIVLRPVSVFGRVVSLNGWIRCDESPESSGELQRINTLQSTLMVLAAKALRSAKLQEKAIKRLQPLFCEAFAGYVAAEIDPALTKKNADREKLDAMVRWAFSCIHD